MRQVFSSFIGCKGRTTRVLERSRSYFRVGGLVAIPATARPDRRPRHLGLSIASVEKINRRGIWPYLRAQLYLSGIPVSAVACVWRFSCDHCRSTFSRAHSRRGVIAHVAPRPCFRARSASRSRRSLRTRIARGCGFSFGERTHSV